MSLIADYALTPSVFDTTSYSTEETCGLHLQTIRDVLMTEGLVRDLRSGEWRSLFSSTTRSWHRRSKEIIKKLATQGRLVEHEASLSRTPNDDIDWCEEALASHANHALTGGVIVTRLVKEEYPTEPLVASIDKLPTTTWWKARSPSVRLTRTCAEYVRHLELILRHSNSLVFVDPHLDPARRQYRDLATLISCAGGRTPPPTIEIHRVCYEGSGSGRIFPLMSEPAYFETRFRDELATPLSAAGLAAEVFVWDEFHDRYLISNLIGVLVPNGFDVTNDPKSMTTWTRLGRDNRDDVQREFEEASKRHVLRQRFTIP